jgi:DNA-binding MarR family transcriptional regulator
MVRASTPVALAPSAAGEPPWLALEERAAWLSIVRVATLLPSVLDAQLERDAGLSFFEYTVLAMLSERPDGILRMSELAGVTNASLSRLSHVAKRLESQGLMRRKVDRDDGRCTNAILTRKGRAKVERSAPDHVAAVRELVIDALTPTQLRALRVANERILALIDPEAATDPSSSGARRTGDRRLEHVRRRTGRNGLG